MKRIINTIFAATLLAVSVISCQKAKEVRETDPSSGTMNVSKDEKGHRRDDRMNRIHEIFHTFGMNHPKEGGCQGIMHYPPLKPTITDANSLIYNQYMTERRIKK